MLAGTVILEDTTIVFQADDKQMVQATITATFKHVSECILVPQDKFFSALSIAVHTEGMPDYQQDYPSAEAIMKKIRWIP